MDWSIQRKNNKRKGCRFFLQKTKQYFSSESGVTHSPGSIAVEAALIAKIHGVLGYLLEHLVSSEIDREPSISWIYFDDANGIFRIEDERIEEFVRNPFGLELQHSGRYLGFDTTDPILGSLKSKSRIIMFIAAFGIPAVGIIETLGKIAEAATKVQSGLQILISPDREWREKLQDHIFNQIIKESIDA